MEERNKNISQEELRENENNAIEKYEEKNKSTKAYRQPKYKPKQQVIRCQKCGSSMNLTKTNYDGVDFWFCKSCIMKRVAELNKKK